METRLFSVDVTTRQHPERGWEYRAKFMAHGYKRVSPWLKSKRLALHWAADFWVD